LFRFGIGALPLRLSLAARAGLLLSARTQLTFRFLRSNAKDSFCAISIALALALFALFHRTQFKFKFLISREYFLQAATRRFFKRANGKCLETESVTWQSKSSNKKRTTIATLAFLSLTVAT
jgi:hypothetical protein